MCEYYENKIVYNSGEIYNGCSNAKKGRKQIMLSICITLASIQLQLCITWLVMFAECLILPIRLLFQKLLCLLFNVFLLFVGLNFIRLNPANLDKQIDKQ